MRRDSDARTLLTLDHHFMSRTRGQKLSSEPTAKTAPRLITQHLRDLQGKVLVVFSEGPPAEQCRTKNQSDSFTYASNLYVHRVDIEAQSILSSYY